MLLTIGGFILGSLVTWLLLRVPREYRCPWQDCSVKLGAPLTKPNLFGELRPAPEQCWCCHQWIRLYDGRYWRLETPLDRPLLWKDS
jgi:hypothetical protein